MHSSPLHTAESASLTSQSCATCMSASMHGKHRSLPALPCTAASGFAAVLSLHQPGLLELLISKLHKGEQVPETMLCPAAGCLQGVHESADRDDAAQVAGWRLAGR